MLAWLRALLGRPSASTSRPSEGRETNVGHGGFGFEVVGEQSYQSALRKVSAGRVERGERVTLVCHLRYEINSHTHGPAVRVDTSGGSTLGHFPASQALMFADAINKLEQRGEIAVCEGVLVGGQPDKPSFGIYLDFKPKLLSLYG